MVSCAACNRTIYSEVDGSRADELNMLSDSSLSALVEVEDGVIFDSGIAFCGDECAPRQLRDNPPEKDPLQAVIEFFHQSNTEESLEYYKNRGWTEETIDELLLGWAPPDELAAYKYLEDEGYSVAEILSTGLFSQQGEPPFECLWRGRYVFPYFEEDKSVSYAISRSTGSKGGGAAGYDGHPKDIMSGKYTKLAKNKPYSIYDDHIYGLHSLDQTDNVIIAEGMPDAITAIQEGYSSLSPVTVQFSHEQYDNVEEIISEKGVDTVYIVPDNEEVQDTQEDQGRDISVGLEGGLKTAAHLLERDIDAEVRVVELPKPEDRRKIDLDDYLNEHTTEEFEQILDTADAPEDHEEVFEDIRETVEEQISYRENQEERSQKSSSGKRSAIFDLSILDVLPSDFSRKGDRGPSPLQHIGNSTNYFSVTEYKGSLIAHDFKRNVTYTPMTYILAEIGAREIDDPNGSLSDKEIWQVWKWAKENNVITSDDPLPSAAIAHIAKNDIGYEFDEQDEDGFVPYDIYITVLKRVKNRYGLDPGRSIPD